MNLYAVIALIISVLVLSYVFGIIGPIREMLSMVLDIPELEGSLGSDPIYKLAIRFTFLIVLYQIIKMLITRRD